MTPALDLPDDTPEPGGLGLLELADVQDHLLTVESDLARLEALLDSVSVKLWQHCQAAHACVSGLGAADAAAREQAVHAITEAMADLQFQDMASQLILHARRRLVHCSDLLAAATFADDEEGMALVADAPPRPSPVTQVDMSAGSVELF